MPALDGMRLLAVLMVVFKHTGMGASSSFAPLRMVGIFAKVGSGVPLFFVISGFLITGILMDTAHTADRYRNFLARRSLRIFPLYYLYFAAAIVVTYFVTASWVKNPWVFAAYLQNVFLFRADQTNSQLPLYHLWTLGVQEQFYVLWPLLVWGCRSLRDVRKLCWLIFFASVACRIYVISAGEFRLSEVLMPCRAGEMSLGGLFALEYYGATWISKVWPKLMLPLGSALVLLIATGRYVHPFSLLLLQEVIALFSVALLAAVLVPGSWSSRMLGCRPMSYLGRRYSYGLFIFHPAVLIGCERLLHLGHGFRDGLERAAGTVVGGLLLSAIFYSIVENPCLRLKAYFSARPRSIQGEVAGALTPATS